MAELGIPRGTRDFNPSETISLKEIVAVVEDIFKRFGFYPIDTPRLENMDVLNAKAYGDEAAKEIYVVSGESAGLRFDLTVPLARYIAMNRNVNLPFKRYQIDRAWRKDEPQHMRAREFLQADVDIVGSSEPASDAEAVAAAALALEGLGLSDYSILINNRNVLNAVLESFSIPKEKVVAAVRSIDKLPKTGKEGVVRELTAGGIDARKAEDLLNFLEQGSSNDALFEKVLTTVPAAKEEVDRLKTLFRLLEAYSLRGKAVFDLSLARGLDYYTSFVWEFVVYIDGKRAPTLAAGGRYDNLIGIYSKQSLPATGVSIGISRLFDILDGRSVSKTYAQVFVAYIGKENQEYATSVANYMRGMGIYADLNLTTRNLAKQLEYANALGIKYVAVLGNKERDEKKVRLKNMLSGEENLISVDEAVTILKKQ